MFHKTKLNFLFSLVFISSISVLDILAFGCSDYAEFKEYNGHYYTVTVNKYQFLEAKKRAEDLGGYLAIPNNQSENDYIKSLLGGGRLGWIGVYDPNYIQNYCYGGNCSYDDTRFLDIKANPLLYKNFAFNQPDNLVKEYDVLDGKNQVSPIGEFWVAMSGNNGLWGDFGHHKEEFMNPVRYYAVFEFDSVPDCFNSYTDDTDWSVKKCNPAIYDDRTETLLPSKTVDCLEDIHGTDYCPEALADAGEYWDTEDGYSIGIGVNVIDYVAKVETTSFTDLEKSLQRSDFSMCWNSGRIYEYGYKTGWYGAIIPFPKPTNWYDVDYVEVHSEKVTGCGGTIANSQVNKMYLRESLKCNDGILEDGKCKKVSILCPDNYTETGQSGDKACKKAINYTYYNYLCSDELNKQKINYVPSDVGGDLGADATYSSTPPVGNCKRQGFTCNSNIREPVFVNGKWQCSPFPCYGEENTEVLGTPVGTSDKNNDGWGSDGSCGGNIYIFNGKDNRCRSWDMFFGLMGGGCCDKDKVFFGLVPCKEHEKKLAKLQMDEKTHYVGEYCSRRLKLGFIKICIEKSKSYCAFNSKLALIINEQARPQIGKGWGSADNPQCEGFTPDEFQKIDFSTIDLSVLVEDITDKVNSLNFDNLGGFVQDKVKNFYSN